MPISNRAVHELRLWFYDRNLMTIKAGEEDYVFLNRRGAHLTRTMILIMKIYTHIDTSTLRQEILEHHPRNNQLQNRLSK